MGNNSSLRFEAVTSKGINMLKIQKELIRKFGPRYPEYEGSEVIEFRGKGYRKIADITEVLGLTDSGGCSACCFDGQINCPGNCINPSLVYMEVTDDD